MNSTPAIALLTSLHGHVAAAVHAQTVDLDAALVGADFRMLAADGSRVDRAALLAAAGRPQRRSETTAVASDVRVRLFASTALVHALVDDGGPRRLRTTDVFHWDGDRWWLVGAQATPLREGVAATLQAGTAPEHAPWQGSDPVGDAADVLRRLNERYVQSYREADVGWYDAHLAPDYVVTNGDGSFVDRAGALSAFARSTFATHMRSFPVDQVVIRRFGELALIEAENAYELKDGRTGISRYGDIWQVAQGRWRCVSAHITAAKLP